MVKSNTRKSVLVCHAGYRWERKALREINSQSDVKGDVTALRICQECNNHCYSSTTVRSFPVTECVTILDLMFIRILQLAHHTPDVFSSFSNGMLQSFGESRHKVLQVTHFKDMPQLLVGVFLKGVQVMTETP